MNLRDARPDARWKLSGGRALRGPAPPLFATSGVARVPR